MSSSANDIFCQICSASKSAGQGKAIFTAECSHSFHFTCITSYVTDGKDICPVCNVKWNDLPFAKTFNLNSNNNSGWNHTYTPFHFSQIPPPQYASPFPQYTFPQYPTFEPEPSHFSDDEPLLAATMDADNSASSVRLHIKGIPEKPAVAASESVSQFAVLVGLKAPVMPNNATDLHRAPLDLVTVLDVSGSMLGFKLDLVKRAVLFVIDNLGASDRLSIVSFSSHARRILCLRRMTEHGREAAKQAVNSLFASGNTNIVEGLRKGVRVLEERREKNPVSSIIFLSDGNDTCNYSTVFPTSVQGQVPHYLNLLPASIRPQNRTLSGLFDQQTFPVHSFGFGSDHDPIAMHSISDSSGGTFSFIESFEMVQDAFANCIGGLLSVVIQELRLSVKAASHGVEIKSIPSGRYISEITNHGSDGVIKVGDMYAEEDREFLVNLSVPKLPVTEDDEGERKTSLLDITCSYMDVVSKEILLIEADLVEIRRPKNLSPLGMVINIEVDRQRNRLFVADSISEAQRKAESGDLAGAQAVLSNRQSTLASTPSAQAGDTLCKWLEAEINETQARMGSMSLYQQSGRAFALSGMSSHVSQRATTRGSTELFGFPQSASASTTAFGAYATPFMQQMVSKSQQLNKTGSSSSNVATLMEE